MREKVEQNPQTVEDVFRDFKGRRLGIIKALTSDFDKFYKQCDPKMSNLCLYGFPNQQWEVHSPYAKLPEPKSGINFLKHDLNKIDWLSLIALHSDAWLISLASYFGAKSGFECANRKLLYGMISGIPTVHEVVRGGNFTMKMAKKEDPFPVELWIEIFSRIPVESLIRIRCVCKRLRFIIDDPMFVSMHLSAYKNNNDTCHWFVAELPLYINTKEQFFLRHSETFMKIEEPYLTIDLGETCNVVGCINGVVLIHKKYYISESIVDTKAILWNPSIRKVMKVPSFPFSTMYKGENNLQRDPNIGLSTDILLRDRMVLELGFGFDTSRCDPKVVAIFYPSVRIWASYFTTPNSTLVHYRAQTPGLVAIYSAKMGSWRRLDIHSPCWWRRGPQAFLNQAIHWFAVGDNKDQESKIDGADSFIISFDVYNEVFNYMELPDWENKSRKDIIPAVMNEKLALFEKYLDNGCTVWVMDEYGVPSSWEKLYKFELDIDRFLCLKDEVMLFVEDEGVKVYNMKSKITKDLVGLYLEYAEYNVYAYQKSLVLSNLVDGHLQVYY